jgi:NAD(P)-dependent dehydrogenase (short-subunit alcohol dehydrogenase family)
VTLIPIETRNQLPVTDPFSPAFKGSPLMLPYVSSKGAVIALTGSVAREVRADGIRVNCVAPRFTVSDGTVANTTHHKTSRQNSIGTRCIAREQTPQDVTGAIGFLLSSESDFMTGQTLVVDGGSVMN